MVDKQSMRTMHEVTRTVQLQRRQLFFWVLIVFFAIGLFFLIHQGRYIFADDPVIEDFYDYSGGISVTIPVEVGADGSVLVNGKPASLKVFQPLGAFDELHYKAVDKPEIFVDSFIVNVTFEQPLPANTQIRSFAVHGVDSASERQIDSRTIQYTASGIGPDATFTVVAQLPKGSIAWPWWRQTISIFSQMPLGFWLAVSIALPLLTVMVLVVMFWSSLRQLSSSRPSILMAPPKPLPPAVVGILVRGRVSAREIAATILDLAQRGYLTIYNKDETHFTFAKRRAWTGLRPFELQLLTQIFQQSKGYKTDNQNIELSVGETLFSPDIAKVYLAMYDAAVAAGYFRLNPAEIHRRYRLIGLLLFFIGLAAFTIIMFFDLQPSYLLFLFAGMMTMALVIIVAADSVPLLTLAGETARQDWLAFKRYLMAKEQISYTEGAQAAYERFLPYAVVLSAEVEWLNRFSRHPFRLPSWYDAAEKTLAIEDFAQALYRITGSIALLFSSVKEPTVH